MPTVTNVNIYRYNESTDQIATEITVSDLYTDTIRRDAEVSLNGNLVDTTQLTFEGTGFDTGGSQTFTRRFYMGTLQDGDTVEVCVNA